MAEKSERVKLLEAENELARKQSSGELAGNALEAERKRLQQWRKDWEERMEQYHFKDNSSGN